MKTRPSRPTFRRSRIALSVLCVLASQATSRPAEACTNFLVTRGASVDGSTMVSYSADSHVRYGELYLRRGGTWPKGTKVALFDRGDARPLGEIPQASRTYNVIGFMNENQVAIGESTFGGRKELEDKTGVVDYGSLMFLAMDRARTRQGRHPGHRGAGGRARLREHRRVVLDRRPRRGLDHGDHREGNGPRRRPEEQ